MKGSCSTVWEAGINTSPSGACRLDKVSVTRLDKVSVSRLDKVSVSRLGTVSVRIP